MADKQRRRREAQDLIDKILNGTPDGRVDPKISEDLRKQLVKHNGDPELALLAHFKAQGVVPESVRLRQDGDPPAPPKPPWGERYRSGRPARADDQDEPPA